MERKNAKGPAVNLSTSSFLSPLCPGICWSRRTTRTYIRKTLCRLLLATPFLLSLSLLVSPVARVFKGRTKATGNCSQLFRRYGRSTPVFLSRGLFGSPSVLSWFSGLSPFSSISPLCSLVLFFPRHRRFHEQVPTEAARVPIMADLDRETVPRQFGRGWSARRTIHGSETGFNEARSCWVYRAKNLSANVWYVESSVTIYFSRFFDPAIYREIFPFHLLTTHWSRISLDRSPIRETVK